MLFKVSTRSTLKEQLSLVTPILTIFFILAIMILKTEAASINGTKLAEFQRSKSLAAIKSHKTMTR